MPLNLNNVAHISTKPAFMNYVRGTISITVSGTVAAGATGSYDNSAVLSRESSIVRLYASQNVSPGGFADYDNTALLAYPGYIGVNGIFVACSVAGDPSVASEVLFVHPRFTATGLSINMDFHNPYAGTLTWTTTIVTFTYESFLPTPT